MTADTVFILLDRITSLAIRRDTPFIIQANPRLLSVKHENTNSPTDWPDQYLATIGNVSVSFDGYSVAEMLDLYAELKAGLEVEEAATKASRVAWDKAQQAYNAKST